jgi:class 3 adenylate cyclase
MKSLLGLFSGASGAARVFFTPATPYERIQQRAIARRKFTLGLLGNGGRRPATLLVAAVSRRRAGPRTIVTSPELESLAAPRASGEERGLSRSSFFREVARRRSLTFIVVAGFVFGVGYRAVFNGADERTLGNFLLSGIHGGGLALTILVVQIGLASAAHSRLGAALRRLPLGAEIVVRALVMTAALIVVGLLLQALLYAETFQLRWATPHWFTVELPRIVALMFGLSLVIGAAVEIRRLVGGPMLTSALLGTYHRPTRRRLIVMFLDLAHSTSLAEAMGELKVHDLVTRFFYDIDAPIGDFGGAVHAYVGDEVIVSWPVSDDPALNARSVASFFATERTIRRLAPDYERDFGVTPGFRAGLHAGFVVVSECGDAKRQLAYFGDTMNVAARLCDYCKSIDERLVISGDLKRLMTIPADCSVGEGEIVTLRGRREAIEAYVVRERTGPVAANESVVK